MNRPNVFMRGVHADDAAWGLKKCTSTKTRWWADKVVGAVRSPLTQQDFTSLAMINM